MTKHTLELRKNRSKIEMIRTYHAHVYFALDEMALATQVRANILKDLPQLTYAGQLIPIAIGPHPKPMFEMHILASHINLAMASIDALREGLSVLIHPVQHDEMAAHTADARWLGEKLTLNLEILKRLTR
jgi:aromatic ring-cleaving dioxygenase